MPFFETSTAVTLQVQVFWVVTPCNVVVGYQSFRGPCCLHAHHEGGSMDLWNFGTLPHHMESQPRKSRLHPEDAGSMYLYTLVSYHNTTQHNTTSHNTTQNNTKQHGVTTQNISTCTIKQSSFNYTVKLWRPLLTGYNPINRIQSRFGKSCIFNKTYQKLYLCLHVKRQSMLYNLPRNSNW
jgi:hypothetical protein